MNVEMQANLCIGALLYLCLFDLLRRRQEDCGELVKDGCAFVFVYLCISIFVFVYWLTLYICSPKSRSRCNCKRVRQEECGEQSNGSQAAPKVAARSHLGTPGCWQLGTAPKVGLQLGARSHLGTPGNS